MKNLKQVLLLLGITCLICCSGDDDPDPVPDPDPGAGGIVGTWELVDFSLEAKYTGNGQTVNTTGHSIEINNCVLDFMKDGTLDLVSSEEPFILVEQTSVVNGETSTIEVEYGGDLFMDSTWEKNGNILTFINSDGENYVFDFTVQEISTTTLRLFAHDYFEEVEPYPTTYEISYYYVYTRI